ncbi:unnamed protein product, partial [Closterium sp. NIES-53]
PYQHAMHRCTPNGCTMREGKVHGYSTGSMAPLLLQSPCIQSHRRMIAQRGTPPA